MFEEDLKMFHENVVVNSLNIVLNPRYEINCLTISVT